MFKISIIITEKSKRGLKFNGKRITFQLFSLVYIGLFVVLNVFCLSNWNGTNRNIYKVTVLVLLIKLVQFLYRKHGLGLFSIRFMGVGRRVYFQGLLLYEIMYIFFLYNITKSINILIFCYIYQL